MSEPPPAGSEGTPGEIIPLRLPVPARLFEKRAARFRALAPGHTAGDFLGTLADLAWAQCLACREVPLVTWGGRAPRPAVPLDIAEWHRGAAWREALGVILAEMGKAPLPGPGQAAVARLGGGGPAELEASADALLAGAYDRIDLAAAPFVGAALQVYWTALAAGLPAGGVERAEHGCPVCGSPPVAAVVLGDDRLRYLTCSLCAAEWHLTRVTCATCHSAGAVSYFSIEGDREAAKAEACEECRTYLKLFYLEKDPHADPFADDAATLALDLLMAEEGYARGGLNLFVLSSAGS
jgi:FdhE protein